MCHKGQPFRPYGLHVWGPTLEVCNNDSYENPTKVPLVFLAQSQRCLNTSVCVDVHISAKSSQKKTAVPWAMGRNGRMSNVTAIISSIITTIKLKSWVRFKWSKREGNGKNADTFLWLGSQYSVTVQVVFLALALTLGDCIDFTRLSRLCNHSQVSS